MVTASHNPKEYNGYKVYWEDGGQIPPDKADLVAEKLENRKSWVVEISSENEARERGLFNLIGQEVDRAYLEAIKRELIQSELTNARGKNLSIVFSPLHGTGGIPVQQILKETGFTSVFTVPEQREPIRSFQQLKYQILRKLKHLNWRWNMPQKKMPILFLLLT
jgi:phosphoglucomutase